MPRGDRPRPASCGRSPTQAGTQGAQLARQRAALETADDPIREVHRNHHTPISSTAAGLIVLEPAA